MMEAAFPVFGSLAVLLLVLPACALAAKVCLSLLERQFGGPLQHLGLRYVLLTGSSLLPLAWLLSAGLHQVEAGRSRFACLVDHDVASLCFEPAFFALLLAGAVFFLATRSTRWGRVVRAANSSGSDALNARLAELLGGDPSLRPLLSRLVATDEVGFALGTFGVLRNRIFVGTVFAAGLTDEMLISALAHEWQHARSFDPLRYVLLQLSLAVNPIGRLLLESHASLWLTAREAHCDREAVMAGAAPLALASAIVKAARPPAPLEAALGSGNAQVLKLRVGLLIAFTERLPLRRRHEGPAAFSMSLALLSVALLLPHQASTAALDLLHTGVEQALNYLVS